MRTHAPFRSFALALAATLVVAVGGGIAAQESGSDGPLSNVILAGYGGAVYDATLGHDLVETSNNFAASVSPVLLYGMGDDLLFEAELEFGISGQTTTTTLEYAQIDYLGFEKLQFTAGKFLLPFGVFGERLHPSWINKLPVMPLLFGHAHGGVADGSLLPILSDAGVMGRFSQPVGGANLNVSVYVTQGPRLMSGEEDHDDAHSIVPSQALVAAVPGHDGPEPAAIESGYDIPDVGYGVSFSDNNSNKMVGARVGYVRAPALELYVSGFHAMYDAESYLDMQGFALTAQTRRWGFELLAEGAFLRQEFATGETTFKTVETPGYYVEASRRIGSFEPVVRWSQLLDGEVDGTAVTAGLDQLALGLNYWVAPMVPLKVAYLVDPDFDDRVLVQWAFGF